MSTGEDPSTGERIILTDSVPIEQPGNARSERAAQKEAEKLRTRLLADADDLEVARTRATVGALLDRWMTQHEIDPRTWISAQAPSGWMGITSELRTGMLLKYGESYQMRRVLSTSRRSGCSEPAATTAPLVWPCSALS
ncbi:hypothetical protein GCM10010472_26170 [Pseudonocardia halophobica]|uniref:Uncharacterized protein n=1 Tax=Pseudonocardia halophobica TaxID=29401 RepID=A0A9W6NTY0_9PSEU|nr:hypothetical protein [Pseudonocardia halophobica]GLL08876.1 hypothetical protein GCM10017577_00160 [Pseudonocardia halophobica]